MMKLLRLLGTGLRNGLVAIGALAFLGTMVAVADYALTQGSGTNFASKVISTVHYAAGLICDATAGETQCATVSATGSMHTLDDNSAALLTAAQAGVAANGTTYPTSSVGFGALGKSSTPTAVSDGQIVPFLADLQGRAVTLPYALPSAGVRGTATSAGSATTTLIAAQGSGTFINVVSIQCWQEGVAASPYHATLNDTETTGSGTIVGIPGGSTGNGNNQRYPVALRVASNTALTFTPSAANNTTCNAQGFVTTF